MIIDDNDDVTMQINNYNKSNSNYLGYFSFYLTIDDAQIRIRQINWSCARRFRFLAMLTLLLLKLNSSTVPVSNSTVNTSFAGNDDSTIELHAAANTPLYHEWSFCKRCITR